MADDEKKVFNPVEQCADLKKTYDVCFKKWYASKFLKVCLPLHSK